MNGAKQRSNNKLSSLGTTCENFMHSPACTKKAPSGRSCWVKAIARGHWPHRKITPVFWGDTGRDAYPTASQQMEVPPPLSSSSLCLHALPAARSLSVAGVGLDAFPSPAPCAYVYSSNIWSTFLLESLWTPGAPEGPPWGFPLASRLSSSKEHSGDLWVPSPRQCTNSAGIVWDQGTRAPDPVCILGAEPSMSKSPQQQKTVRPNTSLTVLCQSWFNSLIQKALNIPSPSFHSSILRHNLKGFLWF